MSVHHRGPLWLLLLLLALLFGHEGWGGLFH